MATVFFIAVGMLALGCIITLCRWVGELGEDHDPEYHDTWDES